MTEKQAKYAVPGKDIYEDLSREFDDTFKDQRGGIDLEYITGEQATTRLNETLGFMGWSFRVIEHGIHAEADECWALGELTVHIGPGITRQQFGSQKVKRSRASGAPLDIGFDLKGAATDSLKKCASLIGVALYLWKKTPPATQAPHGNAPPAAAPRAGGAAASTAEIRVNEDGEPVCQLDRDGRMCGAVIQPWAAKGDNAARDAFWVAAWQIKRPEYGMPLCTGHQFAVKDGKVDAIRWQPREPVAIGQTNEPPAWSDDDLPF